MILNDVSAFPNPSGNCSCFSVAMWLVHALYQLISQTVITDRRPELWVSGVPTARQRFAGMSTARHRVPDFSQAQELRQQQSRLAEQVRADLEVSSLKIFPLLVRKWHSLNFSEQI
jgi:hypothetical protein